MLQGALVVVVAASVAFLLIKALPGDQFSDLVMSPNGSAELLARQRAYYGDNQPLLTQYWHWMQHTLRGDLQNALEYGHKPVVQVIGEHLPATLELMALAFVASLGFGIALGTWQGTHAGARGERFTGALGLFVISVPEFWLALILLFVFAIKLRWFPSMGTADFYGSASFVRRAVDHVHHLFLPWLSLTLIDVAVISRYQRAAMQAVVGQQFLQTARAKGVPERTIKWHHALRVAVLPIITIAGLYFPALFVGAVLIEQVFSWPGIGRVLTDSIGRHDYFVVTGIVVVGSAMTAAGSLLADVTRELADPRLRQ